MSKKKNKDQDLGFGSSLSQKSGRLINKDGSFNIIRKGFVGWDSYQYLISVGNIWFVIITFTAFVLINCLFALGFLAIGINTLSGIPKGDFISDFLYAFFFSVQSFTTVGYGAISPISISANFLASICSLIGLLGAALVTGLFFARFVSPKSHIAFSKNAIIVQNNNQKSFKCRLVNIRDHKIINLQAQVVLSWTESGEHDIIHRKFSKLKLEREEITLFPLNWTLVHFINEKSPLYKKTFEELKEINAEFLVMITAYDESYNQTIHADVSYTCEEIIENAQFKTMYKSNEFGNATELYLDDLDAIIK